MKTWSSEDLAHAAGARLLSSQGPAHGPERASIDSRDAGSGTLFVGLPGASTDGGAFGPQAFAAGAWGVLIKPEYADAARAAAGDAGVILVAEDTLLALQKLATAWRRHLRAQVIGVTGSTGKTSTKDLLRAILAPDRRTVASRANFNTEIGLPLEILAAPDGTEVLVLEMGMRGSGQIAELAAIAEPDVAVIVSIGPVHLELLGSLEAIAAAKAELIAGLRSGGTAVIPAGEILLREHLRSDITTVSFGAGGDVRLLAAEMNEDEGARLTVDLAGRRLEVDVPFTQAHLHRNVLAALAAARAVGVVPHAPLDVALSPGRGQRIALPRNVILIDDCYNANPMSMRAALDDLAATAARRQHARRVAVLGDMLELGPQEREFHREIGSYATTAVDVLVSVGPLAAETGETYEGEVHAVADAEAAASILPELICPGDVILVKASRGVGLELVCEAMTQGTPA